MSAAVEATPNSQNMEKERTSGGSNRSHIRMSSKTCLPISDRAGLGLGPSRTRTLTGTRSVPSVLGLVIAFKSYVG